MKNVDIRIAIKEAGLTHWEVASAYRLHEGNFSRLLRNELGDEGKRKIFDALEIARKEKYG